MDPKTTVVTPLKTQDPVEQGKSFLDHVDPICFNLFCIVFKTIMHRLLDVDILTPLSP